jgi:Polyketide cyclase / dehydrase and lipid transport
MFRKILIALGLALLALLITISLQPDEFRIARSTSIASPAAPVFRHLNDFRAWQAWSPWAKLDPNCKNTYSGAPEGVGAAMAWEGNNQVGKGSMLIEEVLTAEKLRIKLVFEKPMAATNEAIFSLRADGNGGTAVEWAMTGKNNFMGKAFGLFVDVDKMVGADFENGLANLKALVEDAN